MGILKPIKKNEFQTLAVKVSQGLHERLPATYRPVLYRPFFDGLNVSF